MKLKLSRRQILGGLALGAAGAPLSAAHAATPGSPPAAGGQPPGVCVVFPQATAGPFYFDPKLLRSDITEGRPGLPLSLTLRIVEAGPCTPITGARVDVWHADAGGVYSGYANQAGGRSAAGETFLRGTQTTDGDGNVVFRTIYPGWYPGRTPHIHLKAFLDSRTLATAQIYFPDALNARIYRERAPYSARPVADVSNGADWIFQAGERDGGGTVLTIEDGSGPIQASLAIAVDRRGRAAGGPGWGDYLRTLLGGR